MGNGANGDKLRQLGVGGFFAITVLYMVFNFLMDIGVVNAASTSGRSPTVERQINDLHTWHDRRDEDGIPLGYVPRSMNRVLEELIEVEREQTALMKSLIRELEQRPARAGRSDP